MQRLKTWPRFLAVAILINLVQFCIVQSKAKAQIQGDVELLKTAAEKFRDNLNKIKTWKGEVKWDQNSVLNSPKLTSIVTECSIEFACDLTLPAKRWSIRTDKLITVVDGKEKVSLPDWRFHIERDGAYYELFYDARIKDAFHLADVANHPYMKPGLSTGTFDPLYFFKYNDEDLDNKWSFLYEHAKSEPMSAYSITRDGNYVVIRLKIKDEPVPRTVYEIDLSKGGNLTKVETARNATNAWDTRIEKWAWQEVNGVWVPQEFTRDHIVTLPKPQDFHYKIRWIKNEVNIPLAKDEFSLVKLGLRQGNGVYDSRTRSTYKITDKSFPPPYNAEPEEQRK